MSSAAAVGAKAAQLGKLAVRMTTLAGAGHPSSALSLAHLVTHLMYRQMRHDPGNPRSPVGDRLVLSEGHAVPIVYAAWADLGGAVGVDARTALSVADLDQLRAKGSVLDGHPNPAEGFPFFDAATGSLGMGLSVAAGLALAARLDGCDRRIFCIVGDGESREGQIWEAADFIVDHKLSNVCAIFNCNGQGQAANVSPQQSAERIAAKLSAFGWNVKTIDGHNPAEIEAALAGFPAAPPTAIVARTIKGWGADMLQKGNWHGKPPKESDLPAINAALDAAGGSGGPIGRPPLPAPPKAESSRPDPREVAWPSFGDTMKSGGLAALLEKRAMGTRRAYGATLKAAGELLPQVVVLDADVSNSTFSEIFAAAHPTRFFECKIAEQNMVSAAAGLSAGGYIPFANSFAKFIGRAYDQVELAAISRANVKLVGSHSGITPCSDGPSQMALADVAFFRALTTVRNDERTGPVCWLFQPSDAVAAYHCTRLMLAIRGMCYMRTHRPDVPLLYDETARFEPGGVNVLQPGDDLALVASGYMVHEARKAAELLSRQNIRAALIDAYSLPIQAEKLVDALRRCGGRALVVEDNYGGGYGAAAAEAIAAAGGVRCRCLSVQRIPKSTRTESEELEFCGVGAAQIADQALALLKSGV
ncbi:Transketolase [Phycisphaerae bacterium RAS1]|nr:Transketolase [Phycisphaerae bacterium RAS1]